MAAKQANRQGHCISNINVALRDRTYCSQVVTSAVFLHGSFLASELWTVVDPSHVQST